MLVGILKPTGGELSVLSYHPHPGSAGSREAERRGFRAAHHTPVRPGLGFDLAVTESLRLLRRVCAVREAGFQEWLALFDTVLDLGKLVSMSARKLSPGRGRCFQRPDSSAGTGSVLLFLPVRLMSKMAMDLLTVHGG
jgi:ABC-type uncharacterized transport system ATPase subunit